MESKKTVFKKETNVVSATKGPNVEDGHRKPLLPKNRALKKIESSSARVPEAAVPLEC